MIGHDRTASDQKASVAIRLRAFSVHIFTSFGAAVGLIATLEAVRSHWAAMFGWLGVALIIDAVDGPLARRFEVARVLPNWSGDALDLVVDFITYVFVPAFVIAESGLVWKPTAVPLAALVVMVGALYFADRRMKTEYNYFRGFPALWNVAVFYLFVLQLPAIVASLMIVALLALSFVPIRVLHPVRVRPFRSFNLALTAVWAVLCIWAVIAEFTIPMAAVIALGVIGAYFLFGEWIVRVVLRLRP